MSLNLGEVQLELETPASVASPPWAGSLVPASARRALHDGRIRLVAVLALSAVVAVAFEGLTGAAAARTLLIAASWVAGIQLVERSLRTVQVAAGRFGLATLAAAAGLALASAASYWVDLGLPRRFELFVTACLMFMLLYGLEAAKVRLADLRARVLIVGGGKPTLDLLEVLALDPDQPFRVLGIVEETEVEAIAGVPVLGGVARLRMALETVKPDLVVVAADRGRPEIFKVLAHGAALGFRVVGLPEFYEHAFGRVPIRGMTDAWFMSILHLYQRPYPKIAKRAFDLVFAGVGLLLTAPLFPLLALLIRAGGGPVFYRQTRLGEHGRPFTILKFRSMQPDAEKSGAVWAEEHDPRITKLGRVLRRTRLDELPQLINVVRGDMSIVGPRPERPEFLEMLEDAVPFWSRRHLLRPGITGWAQLRSGYASDSYATEEKLSHDLWYLRHQSLLVDLVICGRTLPALFVGAGR
ncbi:MAG TPA: exopolysaccharide biosynthesis polyprenyl glycosylphosphotransferase [Gaiellaceae bacterium]